MDLKEHVANIVNQYSDMVYKLALARTKNKPDKEIAEALGTKEGTIKSQLHRGRNMSKESLKGEMDYV